MVFTTDLKDVTSKDVLIAWWKWASLWEMTQAGIPVPWWFVVNASTFDHFLETTSLNVEIEAILGTVNHKTISTVENASEKIQSLILSIAMPKDIEKEIYERFMSQKLQYVAVRSSATAEDWVTHAWAWQLDSYLNITRENIIEKVRHCRASLFTPRAIFYRFEKDLQKNHISVAVVVQKMIQSDFSGIAFSVHPITQDKNQMIIEAWYGLWEAIVSWAVTPDSYVIRKHDMEIESINVNHQKKALYRSTNSWNEWHDLWEKGKNQIVSHDQILELAKIILLIENHYGFPCDIEWAYEWGAFYIVQSRPITTLERHLDLLNNTFEINDHSNYEYYIARDFSVPMLQLRYRSEALKTSCYTNDILPYKPYLLLYHVDGTVKSYYDTKGKQRTGQKIIERIKSNSEYLTTLETTLRKWLSRIQKIYENPKALEKDALLTFFDDFETIVPWAVVMRRLCGMSEDELQWIDISNIYNLREKTDKLSSWTDMTIRLSLNMIYPELWLYSSMLTIEEIKENTLPQKDILSQREKSFIYTDDTLFINKTINEIASLYNIALPKQKTLLWISEIHGTSAFHWVVRWRVHRMMWHRDIDNIVEWDIIVSPMTMPDMLPAMQKAIAFITDEWGITCHAAIIAREIWKPCIVGTQNGSQILKDWDLVEVDADNWVVKILQKQSEVPYVFYYESHGYNFVLEDLIIEYYVKRPMKVYGEWEIVKKYIPAQTLNQLHTEGMKITVEDIESSIYNIKQELDTIRWYSIDNKDNRIAIFESLISVLRHYVIFDTWYTEGIYLAHHADDRAQLVEYAKNKIRDDLDFLYFRKEWVLNTLLAAISEKYNIPLEEVIWYRYSEILALINDKTVVEISNIDNRKVSYLLDRNEQWSVHFYVWEKALNKETSSATNWNQIHGIVAHKTQNNIKWVVRIINRDHSNYDDLMNKLLGMQDGEIIVSTMTDPEFTPAIKKASAIITDIWGLLSHAAISAREFNVTCIVGTENATKILKEGDLVEIDVDSGIVRILS